MRIVFLGATSFSAEILLFLIDSGISVAALFTIPKEFDLKKRGEKVATKYKNSYYANLEIIAKNFDIPCYLVGSSAGSRLVDFAEDIQKIAPDVILVMGWYYMIPKRIRELATYGALGIHASLLPKYAGGSPLVWAIINGESVTGITMFRMEDGVDDGDIVAQAEISIEVADTIGSIYQKVIDSSKKMLLTELTKIQNNSIQFVPQDKDLINPLPIRTPDDGLINWRQPAMALYNFIRAQTKPYPCAFSYLGRYKIHFISLQLPSDSYVFDCFVCGKVFEVNNTLWVSCDGGAVQPLVVEVDGSEIDFTFFCRNNNLIGMIFQSEYLESL